MTQHLTPDLIAEALDSGGTEVEAQPAEGWGCIVTFVHKGDGVVQATLYDWDDDDPDDNPDGLETRTFRLVEVES